MEKNDLDGLQLAVGYDVAHARQSASGESHYPSLPNHGTLWLCPLVTHSLQEVIEGPRIGGRVAISHLVTVLPVSSLVTVAMESSLAEARGRHSRWPSSSNPDLLSATPAHDALGQAHANNLGFSRTIARGFAFYSRPGTSNPNRTFACLEPLDQEQTPSCNRNTFEIPLPSHRSLMPNFDGEREKTAHFGTTTLGQVSWSYSADAKNISRR
jgi:hypothetical protein